MSEFCTLSGTYQGTKKTGEVVQVEVWGGTDYGALVWIYWDEKLLFKHNFTFWTVKDAEIEGRRMLNGEWTKID